MNKAWPYLFLMSFLTGSASAETIWTEENGRKIQVWTDEKQATETAKPKPATKAKQKAAPKTAEQLAEEELIAELESEETVSGETGKLYLTIGDKDLGQKKYDITFAYEKDAPEEIGVKKVFEIRKDGSKLAKMGPNTKRKLEFACSLVSFLRNYSKDEKNMSGILDSKTNEYSNEIGSLQSDANLAGTLEELGSRAGYNFATGQPVDNSLLGDAVKSYAVKTVSDMITVYSIGANTSSDRTISEIMRTLADTWLSGNSTPENSKEEFTRDLRASFLVQAVSGKKYLEEIKEVLESKNYFNDTIDYKDIEYFYSQFKDGWTKGGVLKGWKKLEDENFDRQVGKGIGKALAGKYLPNEAKRALGQYNALVNLFNSASKLVETDDERIARRNEELRKFLEDEDIKQIFNVIRIETQEAESFFDNFEKYR